MSSYSHHPMIDESPASEGILATLKTTDRAVFDYLQRAAEDGGVETCTASIREIASACSISERQVQICTRRLIKAGVLERVGYDFSNPDRTKRGTIYKVLAKYSESDANMSGLENKRSIKFLLFWSEEK